MTGWQRFRFNLWKKATQAFGALLAITPRQPIWTEQNYQGYAREGYMQNPYAYACIRQIVAACTGIPWTLFELKSDGSKEELLVHPLLDLIKRPNPMQSKNAFLEELLSHFLLSGESFIDIIPSSQPTELWLLRPDRMTILPGDIAEPVAGYQYEISGNKVTFPREQILHLKRFHPLDDWHGLSNLAPAAKSIDQNNSSKEWNVSLLQNNARPPGVLYTEGNLTPDQRNELRRSIEEKYSGTRNAGRPMVLEGGLKWQEMGFTPSDMSWLDGTQLSAREIAIALNVPPELIGDSSNKTYSNYHEARLALYIENILPLMDFLVAEFNRGITSRFGENLELGYDKDGIEALQEERLKLWEKVNNTDFLDQNEKRAAIGYEEVPYGNVMLIDSNKIPIEMAGKVPISAPSEGTSSSEVKK